MRGSVLSATRVACCNSRKLPVSAWRRRACPARCVSAWSRRNTDNTSISGETIDYGPCAFMDAYDPATVFSSIDHLGRYAYGNQPNIAQWNVARLAETLLPLLAEDEAQALAAAEESLGSFAAIFHAAYLGGLRGK